MPPKARLHKDKDKGKLKSIPKTLVKSPSTSSDPQPSTSDGDTQVQFEVELLWCIQELQTALSSGKLNPKQMQDSTKTLHSLTSNSTPIIRKRQLMRLSFGDYRAKMAEEEAKCLRKNEKIVYLPYKPSKKSVFVKKAPFLQTGKDFKFNFDIKSSSENTVRSDLEAATKPESVALALESMDINKQENETKENIDTSKPNLFHFAPSNNAFRFNFSGDME